MPQPRSGGRLLGHQAMKACDLCPKWLRAPDAVLHLWVFRKRDAIVSQMIRIQLFPCKILPTALS